MYTFLSDGEKVFIINNYETMSLGLIGEKLNRNRQTVKRFYRKWNTTRKISNDLNKKNKSHYTISPRMIQRISKFIKRISQISLKTIIDRFNLDVCYQTLSKALKRAGIRRYKMRIKPKLISRHKAERLAWAKKYIRWKDQWSN